MNPATGGAIFPMSSSVTANHHAAGGVGASTMLTKPSLIEVKPMRFLIMDAPRQSNLHLYIKECRKYSVTDVVRVCEPTYNSGELSSAGIELHEMPYEDGHSPPAAIIDTWLRLVEKRFYLSDSGNGTGTGGGAAANTNNNGTNSNRASTDAESPTTTIAIHCVAGLGRAPAMVALALIEFASMNPLEAVTLIRRHRRGAINDSQLTYLESYRRHYKRSGAEAGCCVIL